MKLVCIKVVTIVIAISFYVINISACSVIVVGKQASADGSVIISQTDCGEKAWPQSDQFRAIGIGSLARCHHPYR